MSLACGHDSKRGGGALVSMAAMPSMLSYDSKFMGYCFIRNHSYAGGPCRNYLTLWHKQRAASFAKPLRGARREIGQDPVRPSVQQSRGCEVSRRAPRSYGRIM